MIVGTALLAVLAGAGGFWGGMAYQTSQDSQAQARFFEQRGGLPPDGQVPGGQFQEGLQVQGGGLGSSDQALGVFQGGGVMGLVKSFEGNVLTLSTAQDVTTVNLSGDTTIIKSVEGTTNDLQPGMRVLIAGEKDEDGNILASRITIVDDDALSIQKEKVP
ncbi:MAG: hypothetical protein A2136_01655 [Chloroflexi bacterium RBG_16_54_11]|nr:MAG: hypothetical protein A2136_01655 [Chloroflexi bacterium RBG_16_54_11]